MSTVIGLLIAFANMLNHGDKSSTDDRIDCYRQPTSRYYYVCESECYGSVCANRIEMDRHGRVTKVITRKPTIIQEF